MIWTTLDSLPLLPEAVSKASKIKNYYVWASFAEKAIKAAGHDHIKTLHGSVDIDNFHRLPDEGRRQIRHAHGIDPNSFVIGFVFRNQLRKSVPNLLEGFKLFLSQEPRSNARLLLHTHWSEGWDIPRLLEEKGIDPKLILTTYACNKCGAFHVRNFTGQEQQCRHCGTQGSLNTTNVGHGVTEDQLNDIYNIMDVYCHPFTSGGQELPVQEAKLTELITLVTDYSCGEDSCSPQSGGIPLEWSEYREPGTQFIKASTYPSSISKSLRKVFKLSPSKKRTQEQLSRKFVIDNYSIAAIGEKLEKIIDDLPPVEWDFEFDFIPRDSSYIPPVIENDSDFIIDLYKNILLTDVDENDEGHKHWMKRLSTDLNRQQVLQYFQKVAVDENNNNTKIELSDLLDSPSGFKKALIVLNGDANSLFLSTALLKSFSDTYKNTHLYFACPPQFQSIFSGNPCVYKTVPFADFMLDELAMIGSGDRPGFVDYYINLTDCPIKNITTTSSNFNLCT